MRRFWGIKCGNNIAEEEVQDTDDGKLFLFAGVDKARFKKPVVPGDQLTLKSEVDTVKRNMWRFNTSALVDGKVCCEATLLCAFQDRDKVV